MVHSALGSAICLLFIPSTGSPPERSGREVLALVDTVSTLPGQPARGRVVYQVRTGPPTAPSQSGPGSCPVPTGLLG